MEGTLTSTLQSILKDSWNLKLEVENILSWEVCWIIRMKIQEVPIMYRWKSYNHALTTKPYLV
jgi:hypothetical protein